MLPVGWYFKTLNSLSPHNLLPHGFSFLKVLFWNSILSILWEFHTANFYQIHPLSPTPSISTPIFPLLSCEFSFSFIFPLSPVYVGQLLLRGTCPGVWSTFLEGGSLRKTDCPSHRPYQIAPQLGVGCVPASTTPCWDGAGAFASPVHVFTNILPKAVISQD